jgi:hypothetical protein
MAKAEVLAKLAISRYFNLAPSETALLLGMTEKSLRHWQTRNSKFIRSLRLFMRQVDPKNPPGELTNVNKDNYKDRIEQRLGRALEGLDRALESYDDKLALDAAKEIHRLYFGQKLTVQHEGSVDHNVHMISGPVLKAVTDFNARRGLPPPVDTTAKEIPDASAS